MYPSLYNPTNGFNVKPDSIKLKDYPDDLISLLSAKSTSQTAFELTKSESIKLPYEVREVTRTDELGYPMITVAGALKYHKNNFSSIGKSGCINFSVKKHDCSDNDYAYEDLTGFSSLSAGTYKICFNLYHNGSKFKSSVIITAASDITNIQSLQILIQNEIDRKYQVSNKPFLCTTITNGLRFKTSVVGSDLSVLVRIEIDEYESEDFLEAFETHENGVFSATVNDTVIFGLKEEESENNEILFVHKTDGNLYLIMADEDGEYKLERPIIPWIFTNEEFNEFEFNFDSSVCNFFVNGKFILAFEPVGKKSDTDYENIIRADAPETNLILVDTYNDNQGDAYDYKYIKLFNTKQHCGNFDVTEETEYDGTSYVEYNYGVITAFDSKSLNFTGSGSFHCEMLDGDMQMVISDSISDFIAKVEALDYDTNSSVSFETANDLIFRITFKSKESEITSFEFDHGLEEGDVYGLNNIINWIRRQLGYPQVPVELTDEQIIDAIDEATVQYNKYRNYDKKFQIEETDKVNPQETDLRQGYSEKEGRYFILPTNISDSDIIDIYFHPRYSCAWFGGGNDFIDNYVAQTFFSRASEMSKTAADYYIYRSSLNDISNLIGTQISWRIYNNHLYITPSNIAWLNQFRIGIVYKQPISVAEIENSYQIKNYALGRSMVTLGNIRSAFGGSFPIGDNQITLNGESLITRGDNLMKEAIDSMKKESFPIWLCWS